MIATSIVTSTKGVLMASIYVIITVELKHKACVTDVHTLYVLLESFMNWIIQDSNNQHKNWVNIYNAACEIGDDACFVSVDDDYTIEHIDKYSIVIGGDDFVDKCVKNKFLSCGIFRDDIFFNVCNYLKIFNEKYLNYDSEVVYFESIKKMSTSDVYFVRPYEDSKVFDGGVYSINDFIREYSYLNSDYMISLASQKK